MSTANKNPIEDSEKEPKSDVPELDTRQLERLQELAKSAWSNDTSLPDIFSKMESGLFEGTSEYLPSVTVSENEESPGNNAADNTNDGNASKNADNSGGKDSEQKESEWLQLLRQWQQSNYDSLSSSLTEPSKDSDRKHDPIKDKTDTWTDSFGNIYEGDNRISTTFDYQEEQEETYNDAPENESNVQALIGQVQALAAQIMNEPAAAKAGDLAALLSASSVLRGLAHAAAASGDTASYLKLNDAASNTDQALASARKNVDEKGRDSTLT